MWLEDMWLINCTSIFLQMAAREAAKKPSLRDLFRWPKSRRNSKKVEGSFDSIEEKSFDEISAALEVTVQNEIKPIDDEQPFNPHEAQAQISDFRKWLLVTDPEEEVLPSEPLERRKSGRRPISFIENHVLIVPKEDESNSTDQSLKGFDLYDDKLAEDGNNDIPENFNAVSVVASIADAMLSGLVENKFKSDDITSANYSVSSSSSSEEIFDVEVSEISAPQSLASGSTSRIINKASLIGVDSITYQSSTSKSIVSPEHEILSVYDSIGNGKSKKKSKSKIPKWFTNIFKLSPSKPEKPPPSEVYNPSTLLKMSENSEPEVKRAPIMSVEKNEVDKTAYPKDNNLHQPNRLSPEMEKRIYQASHQKLSQFDRPLEHQVVISNFMMYILSVHSDVTLRGRGPRKRRQPGMRKSPRRPMLIEGLVESPLWTTTPAPENNDSESSSDSDDEEVVPLGILQQRRTSSKE